MLPVATETIASHDRSNPPKAPIDRMLLRALAPLVARGESTFRGSRAELFRAAMGQEISLVVPQSASTRELTGEVASSLILSTAPTIAFTVPGHLDGSCLMAVAVARARLRGEAVPNILFVDTSDPKACSTSPHRPGAQAFLQVESGYVLDAEGVIYHGIFPSPVPIAVISPSSLPLARTLAMLAPATRSLNSPEVLSLVRDKATCSAFLRENLFPTTSGLVMQESGSIHPSSVERFFGTAERSAYVVKPLTASCGRGVAMMGGASSSEVARAAALVVERYGAALIERWERSYPLLANGTRKDWNIRALATPSGLVGMEARVGDWGLPINKARGARIEEVHTVYEGLARESGPPLPDFERFRGELERLCTAIVRASGAGYLGLDLILTDEARLVVIELNGGNVGGPQSLAEIRATDEEKLAVPHAMAIAFSALARHETFPEPAGDSTRLSLSDSGPETVALEIYAGLVGLAEFGDDRVIEVDPVLEFVVTHLDDLTPFLAARIFDGYLQTIQQRGRRADHADVLARFGYLFPGSLEKAIHDAAAAALRGDNRACAESWMNYVELSPLGAKQYVFLAVKALLRIGEVDRAARWVETIRIREPENPFGELSAVWIASTDRSRVPELRAEYAEKAASRPLDPLPLVCLAQILSAADEHETAVALLSPIMEGDADRFFAPNPAIQFVANAVYVDALTAAGRENEMLSFVLGEG